LAGRTGSKVDQIPSQCEPFVRSAGRGEVDILDTGLVEHRAECTDGSRRWIGLRCPVPMPSHNSFTVSLKAAPSFNTPLVAVFGSSGTELRPLIVPLNPAIYANMCR
jgi:hypothetical protein